MDFHFLEDKARLLSLAFKSPHDVTLTYLSRHSTPRLLTNSNSRPVFFTLLFTQQPLLERPSPHLGMASCSSVKSQLKCPFFRHTLTYSQSHPPPINVSLGLLKVLIKTRDHLVYLFVSLSNVHFFPLP